MLNPSLPPAPPPPAAQAFAVHLDLGNGRLTLTGRLTRRSAHLLHDAVSAMLHADRDTWLVDIASADLGGAVGMQVIGAAYRRLLRHGRRMTLSGADPALQERLVRLRLDHHVLPVPSSPADPRPTPSANP